MRKHGLVIASLSLQLLGLGSAEKYQFFRWNTPGANLASSDVYRRQSPPPGYHPEFGTCGSGTTCENACGPNWISCKASTSLSLFCYNKVDLNQTCCENGSGRACDSGYYCAWQEFGGKVWCCENGQSLEECGVPQSTSSSTTSSATSTSGSSTSSSTSDSSTPSSTTTRETTTSGTSTGSETTSKCLASTVTSWATTTVVSITSIAVTTVTVTAEGTGCSSVSQSSGGSSSATSASHTITHPPSSSSTTRSTPGFNSTATRHTSTIATAGAAGLAVTPLTLALVVVMLPLQVWI